VAGSVKNPVGVSYRLGRATKCLVDMTVETTVGPIILKAGIDNRIKKLEDINHQMHLLVYGQDVPWNPPPDYKESMKSYGRIVRFVEEEARKAEEEFWSNLTPNLPDDEPLSSSDQLSECMCSSMQNLFNNWTKSQWTMEQMTNIGGPSPLNNWRYREMSKCGESLNIMSFDRAIFHMSQAVKQAAKCDSNSYNSSLAKLKRICPGMKSTMTEDLTEGCHKEEQEEDCEAIFEDCFGGPTRNNSDCIRKREDCLRRQGKL
jgi:hypothetical protein